MNPNIIEDVSEILDSFDLGDISNLIEKQIDLSENLSIQSTDYFKPLNYHYQQIMNDETLTDEVKQEATERFHNVCLLFINLIMKEFDLEIDKEWLYDHDGDLPGVANTLYCFFVKDISSNLQELFINFINRNKNKIFEIFEERKNKKDSITLVNKRNYPIELAVILANIYDVSTWILTQIDEQQYFDYLNQDYIPLRVVYPMMQQGIIGGEFVERISESYTENLNLRADVCYKIISYYKALQEKQEES